ncbi:MAG: hypothetical protein ACRD88_21550 [Terriglobia bacterium]
MPWLWENDQEYQERVRPAEYNNHTLVSMTHRMTCFECQSQMNESANELSDACRGLADLGFGGDLLPEDRELLDDARQLTWDLVGAGEHLLLYHKRLAQSDWSYDFLHEHDLDQHWDRYAATRRIFHEIRELFKAGRELLLGYHKLQGEDESFLLKDLDLPKDLETDFVLSRNLFSVGFDEMGVFAAGRGLERVLMQVANRRKLMVPGTNKPASEADLHGLIEAFARVHSKSGTPILDKQVAALLHFARTVRNAPAHPGSRTRRTARELAQVIADETQYIWDNLQGDSEVGLSQSTGPSTER